MVGAGIVGLTAAIELAEQGHQVLLIDADLVGRGVTGQSTAKVTVGTGLRIDQIAERHGEDAVREYVDAGRTGMEWIVRRLNGPKGPLGTSAPHDLCATTAEGVDKLAAHAELARRVGLDIEELPLGVFPDSRHTVRYPNQWMIQPTDYAHHLASRFVDIGGQLALGVVVKGIQGGLTSVVETEQGGVSADHVIAATHVPLGRVPSMLPWTQIRHHAVVFDMDGQVPMALDIDGGWSIRPAPGHGGRRAIALGAEHPVGGDNSAAAGQLHRWATTTWRGRVVGQWSSQDVFVDDHLPLVGRLGGVDRVLSATGFGGWGLALGTAAGLDLAQRVTKDTERWPFWTPTSARVAWLSPAAALQGAKDAASAVADHAERALARQDPSELSPGQGMVVREGTDFVARSLDADGNAHAVSGRCTHLGCIVSWNSEEQSWDCGCHGSRFRPTGEVLHGPAVESLAPVADPASI